MRIVLQPAARSDREVARHFRDTIDTRVRLADHADLIEPETFDALTAIHPEGLAQLWGATPGLSGRNVSRWRKLLPGDGVFFYGEKQIYMAGHIALTFHNPDLAVRLWGRDPNGLTWELIYALVNLRDITLPIGEVRTALGWNDKAFIQGFTVVDGRQAENMVELSNLQDTSNLLQICRAFARPSGTTVAPDGPTDSVRTVNWRREHPALKRRLVELAGDTCGLCGRDFPPSLLVGAHIKKRSHCTEDERKDFDNVGMLACVLGCDSLFERGYVAVGDNGKILISSVAQTSSSVAGFVREHLEERVCAWWSPGRDKYYDWHRRHVFVRTHDGVAPQSSPSPGRDLELVVAPAGS
ncbi:hypothetical protein [Amycolatopsis sp. NPDC051716]|uniref:hypothetical protein n=1 Tax=Amycolatopsis sp. NPDC051716 TaxID=3155804 RepID=UPI0034155D2F